VICDFFPLILEIVLYIFFWVGFLHHSASLRNSQYSLSRLQLWNTDCNIGPPVFQSLPGVYFDSVYYYSKPYPGGPLFCCASSPRFRCCLYSDVCKVGNTCRSVHPTVELGNKCRCVHLTVFPLNITLGCILGLPFSPYVCFYLSLGLVLCSV
jgi:hypothetical protein